MVLKKTDSIPAARLRQELQSLGMDMRGSRSDLVSRLLQAGVYEINDSIPPPAPKLDRTSRYPNHSSVLIGNGAKLDSNHDLYKSMLHFTMKG